jgi:hypothetical protein
MRRDDGFMDLYGPVTPGNRRVFRRRSRFAQDYNLPVAILQTKLDGIGTGSPPDGR